MCAKYYELRCKFKKMHLVKDGTFGWYTAKICVIFGVRFERGIAERETVYLDIT